MLLKRTAFLQMHAVVFFFYLPDEVNAIFCLVADIVHRWQLFSFCQQLMQIGFVPIFNGVSNVEFRGKREEFSKFESKVKEECILL